MNGHIKPGGRGEEDIYRERYMNRHWKCVTMENGTFQNLIKPDSNIN